MTDSERFTIGEEVRIRDIPRENTDNPRTPRYARGVCGVIVASYGVVDNPLDHHSPYPPLYSVKFASELVPECSPGHVVIADIHEEWLDRVHTDSPNC